MCSRNDLGGLLLVPFVQLHIRRIVPRPGALRDPFRESFSILQGLRWSEMSVKEVPERGGENVQSSEIDRRRSPRHALTAIAELMDRRSGARIAVRISDVSQDGCYAGALSVFPPGTKVIVS